MKSLAKNKINRRHFLKFTGAAIALPAFLPGSVFGEDGNTAPSNRINLGVIGMGWQGPSNTQAFLAGQIARWSRRATLTRTICRARSTWSTTITEQGLQRLS